MSFTLTPEQFAEITGEPQKQENKIASEKRPYGKDVPKEQQYLTKRNAANNFLRKGAETVWNNITSPAHLASDYLGTPRPPRANFGAEEGGAGTGAGELAGMLSPIPGVQLIKPFQMIAGASKPLLNLGAKGVDAALQGAASSAALGSTYNPEDPNKGVIPSATIGGAMGAAFGVPGAMANSYLNYARNLNQRAPNITNSPQKVSELSALMTGNKVNVGEYINDPSAQKLYTSLRNYPGAGVREAEQGTLNTVYGKGANLEEKLRHGVSPGRIPEKITKETESLYLKNKEKFGNEYRKINEEAKKEGIYGDIQPYSELVSERFGGPAMTLENAMKIMKINPSANLNKDLQGQVISEATRNLGLPNETKKFYEKLGISPDGANSFESMQNAAIKLGKMGRKTSDKAERAFLMELRNSLFDGMESGALQAGNPGLIEKLKSTNEGWRTKVVPFETKEMWKLRNDKLNEPNVSAVLRKKENKEVYGQLPREAQDLIGYDKLTSQLKKGNFGEKKITPEVIDKLYYGMHEGTANRLFTKAQRKEFEDLNKMKTLTENAKGSMNPSSQDLKSTGFGTVKDAIFNPRQTISKSAYPMVSRALHGEAIKNAYIKGGPANQKELNADILPKWVNKLNNSKVAGQNVINPQNILYYLLSKENQK